MLANAAGEIHSSLGCHGECFAGRQNRFNIRRRVLRVAVARKGKEMTAHRAFWFVVGITALGLGAVGVVLPLLPTTPFVLVAAFAFARSSDRLHNWLLNHKTFGPLIANWQQYGAISRPAKIMAAISMVAVFGLSLVLGAPRLALIIQALVLSGAAAFVLTRPDPPATD